ncbi:MAG TPA: 30S ribosomal protein S27e, partial [Nitrososphaeraceae archaeon]|nr:30S ribosomal protein S27e [Nitrososphaeraceae archaeon]
ILIPQPNSKFLHIKCSKCEEKNIVYSHTTTNIYCKSCNEVLAVKSGGRAKINGYLINSLD